MIECLKSPKRLEGSTHSRNVQGKIKPTHTVSKWVTIRERSDRKEVESAEIKIGEEYYGIRTDPCIFVRRVRIKKMAYLAFMDQK